MNVKNILASLSRIFLRWNSFWYSFEACFNFNLIIVRISHCKRKKTMVFLKEQSSHATTRLLGGWRATFHTSIASEYRDEACDWRTPLFFLCQSLVQNRCSVETSFLKSTEFTCSVTVSLDHSFRKLPLSLCIWSITSLLASSILACWASTIAIKHFSAAYPKFLHCISTLVTHL